MSARGCIIIDAPQLRRPVLNVLGLLMFTALSGGFDFALSRNNAPLLGPASAQAQTPADDDRQPDSGITDDAPTATENPVRQVDSADGPKANTHCGALDAAGLAGLALAGLAALGFRSSGRRLS